MMRHLLAFRPEPGLSETLAAARKLGLPCSGQPLFRIKPAVWECPAESAFDGLLIGSANAIRHGGQQLHGLRPLPVFAVGKKTAEIAAEAGFQICVTGTGGLQGLVDALPRAPLRLLRLSGAERVDLTNPEGVLIEERCVYEAIPQGISRASRTVLASGPVVLLHSALTASHFAAECRRCCIGREGIAVAALGPRIADAAGPGWAQIRSASSPSDAALLALASDMCQ